MADLTQEEIDLLMYQGWVRTLTADRLEEEIADLKFQVQANGEMSESARYHRYDNAENLHLADWEEYEHEAEESQKHLEICQKILEEKEKNK